MTQPEHLGHPHFLFGVAMKHLPDEQTIQNVWFSTLLSQSSSFFMDEVYIFPFLFLIIC